MPQFRITCAVAGREVSVLRALCDGCDPVRPCDEHTERASLWLLTAGAFELRDSRLRHALARILDGDESLTQIALATGFASQSHLTNRFRARFGITPARARTRDGRHALAA